MKAMPWTAPTAPLARSRSPAGTRRVTVVESAMLRMFSTTLPTRITLANTQNARAAPVDERARGEGEEEHAGDEVGREGHGRGQHHDGFFLLRSTIAPNIVPKTAMSSMNEPPMIAVAMTERVSR